MRDRVKARAFLYCLHGGAAVALVVLALHYPIAPLFSWSALFWLVLSLIAGYSVLSVHNTRGVTFNISAGFTVAGAILVLFNPLVAAVLVSLGSLDERDFKRQRLWRDTLGARSMFVICAGISSILFHSWPLASGGMPYAVSLSLAMAPMVVVYFLLNSFITQGAVSALNGRPFLWHYPFKGNLLIGYVFQGFMAVIVVLLADVSQFLAVFVVGPIWAIRFFLEKLVQLQELNEQLVRSFADALDMRDHDTAGHTTRVAALARLLGQRLGLPQRTLQEIYAAGSLHDLGKIGIPDSILLKPSTLSPEEWDAMKQHAVLGASLLSPYRHLKNVTEIMRHHHERFDGAGYPDGLRGDDIPIGARVIAVADTFMVITNGRSYRAARTFEEALEEIRRCSGTQFDPAVVEAFMTLDAGRMKAIMAQMPHRDDRDPAALGIALRPVWLRVPTILAGRRPETRSA